MWYIKNPRDMAGRGLTGVESHTWGLGAQRWKVPETHSFRTAASDFLTKSKFSAQPWTEGFPTFTRSMVEVTDEFGIILVRSHRVLSYAQPSPENALPGLVCLAPATWSCALWKYFAKTVIVALTVTFTCCHPPSPFPKRLLLSQQTNVFSPGCGHSE